MNRRLRTVLLAVGALVVAPLAAVPLRAGAEGHDPTACRPDSGRVQVPGSYFLDTCFDGNTLVMINRNDIPVWVNLSGDLHNPYTATGDPGGTDIASALIQPLSNRLIPPLYEMKVSVGSGSGQVSLSQDADTTRRYGEMKMLTDVAPGISDVSAFVGFFPEVDDAYVHFTQCVEEGGNFIHQAGCVTRFGWDFTFAIGRVGLSFLEVKPMYDLLKKFAMGGLDATTSMTQYLGGLGAWNKDSHTLNVPAVSSSSSDGNGTQSGSTGSSGNTGSSYLANPQLAITGSCDTHSGTLYGQSSGFTPGGSAYIRAWYPNGSEYTNLIHRSGVDGSGSIKWQWPCAGDPAGTYTTEATDQRSGKTTGRVSFSIGAAATQQGPPPPQTYTEESGSHGSPTFQNISNASGQGPPVPAMSNVQVSCKIHPPSTIASASPDGYWYRIASAPWNNQYYAVANTFWNGDVPGQTPYTHNTDWNIPDC